MKTVRCPQCNLVNWTTLDFCRRCSLDLQSAKQAVLQKIEAEGAGQGQSFKNTDEFAASPVQTIAAETQETQNFGNFQPSPQSFSHQNQQNWDYQYSHNASNYSSPKPKTKYGLALFSMILGIAVLPPISFVIGGFIGAVLGMIFGAVVAIVGLLIFAASIPTALISGIVAVRRASKHPREFGGKGFAIAGIACSSIALLVVPLIAAIAVPNLLAARKAANEGSAIATMRKLVNAEASYMASMNGKCGDIQSLIATKMVDVSLAKGEKNGYRFAVANLPEGGCEIHATPLTGSQGTRSFYYSTEDEKIRAANKNGSTAGKSDPALDDILEREESRPKIASQEAPKKNSF